MSVCGWPSRMGARGLTLAAALMLAPVPLAAEGAPQRVASINLCADQLALLLGDPGQVISVSHLAADPLLSTLRRLTTPLNYGSAEELWLLQPDLVLAGPFSARPAIEMLHRLGTPVVEVPIVTQLADIAAQLHLVAGALGHPERAAPLIARVEAAFAIPPPEGPPLRAVIYQPNGYTGGDVSLADDLLAAAGFRNIARDLGRRPDGVLPLEVLLMAQPDLLILPPAFPGASQAEALLRHPALQGDHFAPLILYSDAHWGCGLPSITKALDALRAAHATLTQGRAHQQSKAGAL